VAGRWFSPGTPISSTNKTDHHDIAEILLKVALNTITILEQRIVTSSNTDLEQKAPTMVRFVISIFPRFQITTNVALYLSELVRVMVQDCSEFGNFVITLILETDSGMS
jgi:hypothetical protein